MRRTLLLTNDFPPRAGGIQSYLHELARRLPADDLTVYAPAWEGAAEFDAAQPFPVVRHPGSLMLPVPEVARRAAAIIRERRIETVWFGAAAPLALLTPAVRRAGAARVVASTHGHEVGWSMIPGARQALRVIGTQADVITFVSQYARRRISAALGPQAALEHLPPGVDPGVFRPDPTARASIRARHDLADRPVVVCISRLVRRKGQDALIRAWPQVRRAIPDAVLMLVGDGSDRDRLLRLARSTSGTRSGGAQLDDGAIVFTGPVAQAVLPGYYAAGDLFAMPCRTLGGGLDVEGLGIVFLEASAVGLPVLAGDSGGAPETVLAGRTGEVVDGRDTGQMAEQIIALLADPARAAGVGAAGREWVRHAWSWDRSGQRLAQLLSG